MYCNSWDEYIDAARSGNLEKAVDLYLDLHFNVVYPIFLEYISTNETKKKELSDKYGWLLTHGLNYRGRIVRNHYPVQRPIERVNVQQY